MTSFLPHTKGRSRSLVKLIQRWGVSAQGACTGASAEVLLGRAVAALHNVVHLREPPVTEQETRHWDHMCIFRLYNV